MADSGIPPGELVAAAEPQAAPSRWPAPIRSLRHRDFRYFWIGLLISVSGTWMQTTAQGWLVWQITGQPIYLGLVGACGTVPMLVLTLPAGVIADRYSKHRIVVVTQTLAMAQAFVLAALVHTGAVRVWHVMILAGLLGIVNAFDMPTRQAMVMDLVGREDLFNAVSLNSAAFNSGRIIGPTVAGILVASVGMTMCFFVNALSFLPIILALTTISPRPIRPPAEGSFKRQIGDGMRWVRGHDVAFALLILTAISGVFAMPYTSLLPAFAEKVLGAGPERYGMLMSAPAVGAFATVFVIAWLGHRVRLGVAVTVGTFIFPVALMLFSAVPSFPAALGCLALTGVGMMCFNMVSNTMLQKEPPDELRGRVMSLRAFVFAGLAPLGNLQIGAMGQWFGIRIAIAAGAVVCLLSALVVTWCVPQVRRSR